MGSRGRLSTPPWWGVLSSWGRISLVGLTAAALLAIALGVYIPHQVEEHMLAAQTESHLQVLRRLVSSGALPGDSPSEQAELERFAQTSLLQGDIVRVKLWDPSGMVVYSDDPALIGAALPRSDRLVRALRGEVVSEVSDLGDPENRQERPLASKLLEFYLPVSRDGRVVAVWEIYQSLDRFEDRLRAVRFAVWGSVGSGLAVFAVFLLSSFVGLLRTAQGRRLEAEERNRQLAAILAVSRTVAATLDPALLLASAARAIRETDTFRSVAIVRRGQGVPDDIVAAGGDTDCPATCSRHARSGLSDHDPARSLAIALDGDGLCLLACRNESADFTPEEQTFLQAAGQEIRIGLQNASLYADLKATQREQQRLTRLLLSAHDDERKHIVGEIHDGIAQDLHRVLFGLRGCTGVTPAEAEQELHRLETITDGSIRRLRRLLDELRPSTLEDIGLGAALRGLVDGVRADGLDVRLLGAESAAPEPSFRTREAVFEIAQEALRNVVRHARAAHAVVELTRDDDSVTIRVADDGLGMDPEPRGGLGLWLMRERAEASGGTLAIESDERRGTAICARIPVAGPP